MSFDMFPASHYLTGHELRNAQERIPLPLYWLVRAEMLGLESLDAAYMCMSRAAAYLKGLPSKDIRPILSKAGYYILDQTLPTNTRRPSPTDTQYVQLFSWSFLYTRYRFIAASVSFQSK